MSFFLFNATAVAVSWSRTKCSVLCPHTQMARCSRKVGAYSSPVTSARLQDH